PVEDHARNRGVGLPPALPPGSRERLERIGLEPTANPDRSLSDYPHMRAHLGLLQLRRPPIPVAVPTRKGGKMPPPDGSLLLTGRLIGATNFACPLPKALNLIHREEARQFDVMNGTSGYSNTRYSRCHCGVSHVENHHHTGTIGS